MVVGGTEVGHLLACAVDAAAKAETFAWLEWRHGGADLRGLAARRRASYGGSCPPARPWRALLTLHQISLIAAAEEAGRYVSPYPPQGEDA